HCGLWDSVTAGPYALGLDQWGVSKTTSGWQCAQITSLNSGNLIAWTTTYNWRSSDGIKSFTNIQLNAGINKKLSAIKKMPATWTWSMSSTSVVADVAFDLFTSNSPKGSNVNEIMIWLANYNTNPISYQYSRDSVAMPDSSNIHIAGHTWILYTGSNRLNKVFSFLPSSGPIKSFKGDIYPFLSYLMQHQGLASSQYLVTAQAGVEATSGSATFTTSEYHLGIH
ncbi:concanavalin A-like lectin/glucanase domain-containing protein, partial [Gautieria morchelliformis]